MGSVPNSPGQSPTGENEKSEQTSGPTAKKTYRGRGRPAKPDLDAQKLESFMRNYPTAENTALFFGCTTKRLYRFIKRTYALDFVQFREKHMVATRNLLVQKALDRAINRDSDRMLELCLKNLVGWNSLSTPEAPPPPLVLQYSLDVPPEMPAPIDVTPKGEE